MTAATTSDDKINITVEFTGGLEMLFDNIQIHRIAIPATQNNGQCGKALATATKVKDLIPWLCDNLMKDPRQELFIQAGTIRPGILVLINDADWELEGEDQYELKEGDSVLFVSTLHGG